MLATQRPEYLKKQQQTKQQQQHKTTQEKQYFYVTFLGEIRGRFEDQRLAYKWANAFYRVELGKREANVVQDTEGYKIPAIMPVNKCRVIPGVDMGLSEYIPFVGERYFLWDEYADGWETGYQERDDKCPYACPQRRGAWKAGHWNGSIAAMLEE